MCCMYGLLTAESVIQASLSQSRRRKSVHMISYYLCGFLIWWPILLRLRSSTYTSTLSLIQSWYYTLNVNFDVLLTVRYAYCSELFSFASLLIRKIHLFQVLLGSFYINRVLPVYGRCLWWSLKTVNVQRITHLAQWYSVMLSLIIILLNVTYYMYMNSTKTYLHKK